MDPADSERVVAPDSSRVVTPDSTRAAADPAGAAPERVTVPDSVRAAIPDSVGDDSIFRFLWLYGRHPGDAVPGRVGAPAIPFPSSGEDPGTKRLPGTPRVKALEDTLRAGEFADTLDSGGPIVREAPTSEPRILSEAERAALLQSDSTSMRAGPPPLYRVETASVERSTERRPRELLTWLTPLRTVPSGTYFMPDPIDWGDLPGRQPPAVLLDGIPVMPPAFAEASPDPADPLWGGRMTLRHATPLRLPNNPSGGPLLDYELIRPDSQVVASGVRLSDGSFNSNTDAIYLARATFGSTTHIAWADHKTTGRIEYGSEEGQDLLIRHERTPQWGRWAIGIQNHNARQRLFSEEDVFRPSERWLWDRSAYTALLESRIRDWEVRVDGEVSWHRYGWESNTNPGRRKDGVGRALVHLAGPGTAWSPRATIQLDRHRWRYFQPGRTSFDRTHTGLGLAVGAVGVTKGWQYELSGGRTDPGTGSAGWSAAAELSRRLGAGMDVGVYASRSERMRLLPRMSDDLEVMVGQGVSYPIVDSDPENEQLWQGEVRLRAAGSTRSLGLTVRATELRDTWSTDAGAALFTPEFYLRIGFPDSLREGTIRAVSLTLEGEQRLRWGFAVRGTGWLRKSDPDWRNQLWATPAEMQGELSWTSSMFREEFVVHAFSRGHWSSSRTTPFGTIDPRVRVDGGATAGIGAFRVFLIFENLANTIDESASYVVNFMPLPLRSYRFGLTWRFLD